MSLTRVLIAALFLLAALAAVIVVRPKRVSPGSSALPSPLAATDSQPTIGKPIVPGLSQDVEDLPTTAPVLVTPFPKSAGEIQVVPVKTRYQKGEELEIQVSNHYSQAITYYSGPGCGLYFELKVKTGWQSQPLCLACPWASSKAPCRPRTILPDTKINIARPIENQAPSGTYRAVFGHLNGKVYSSEFTIL